MAYQKSPPNVPIRPIHNPCLFFGAIRSMFNEKIRFHELYTVSDESFGNKLFFLRGIHPGMSISF